jgi:hypothetical protein
MPEPGNFRIELEPSRPFAAALASAHCLAMIAAASSLSGWPLYLSVSGIAISAVACVADALHLSPLAVTHLELDTGGRAAWRNRRGQWQEAGLGADHFVSTLFVVVCLRQSMLHRKWIVIPAGAAPADQFRRLRVWLRWRGNPKPDEPENPAEAD